MKKLIFLFIAMLVTYAGIAETGTAKADTTQKAAYACPMHPEVTGSMTDKCSKCGMSLKPVKNYACPMHPDVTSTKKSAKCSKCGMDLVEVKAKKS
jgi:Cu(I)/Ag(I) efflux system membrane fusion protein/Cu+-exporting ATPase